MKFTIRTLFLITIIVALAANCYRLQLMIPKPEPLSNYVYGTLCVSGGIKRFSWGDAALLTNFKHKICSNSEGGRYIHHQSVILGFLKGVEYQIVVQDMQGQDLYFIWNKNDLYQTDEPPSWWRGWELFDKEWDKEISKDVEDVILGGG